LWVAHQLGRGPVAAGDVDPSAAAIPTEDAASGHAAGPLVLPALLGATIIGTLSNNILNVPLRTVTGSFHASVSAGVLVVSSFVLVLAAGMAITGWVGDRFGRGRTLAAALVLMALAQVGAALAPSLGVLVGVRAVQGLACSAIPPQVMGMLADIYPARHRARVIGAWAAANGAGQAVGPPLGGLLTDLWGWRSIFWLLAPLTVTVLVAGVRGLPPDTRRDTPLHWPGAACLTVGATLLMTAATTVPQHAVPVGVDAVLGCAGAAVLVLFVLVSRRAPQPLIAPKLIVEARFLRSSIATLAQMFALMCVLVAIPLYLTGTLHHSTAVAGALFFALPAAMAVLAPLVGALSDRVGARRVLRLGLAILAVSCLALGWFTADAAHSLVLLCALLILVGVGVALVQTPAATGATRSPAGQSGAALGLFNMVRFGGSAFGAAWVAVLFPRNSLFLLFGGCALFLVLALGATMLGTDPEPASVSTRAQPV
jgi:MFS family permease